MTLLLLPDIIVVLATLSVILVLFDKFTGRVLIHLDTLRTLATKAALDYVSVIRATQQAEIDAGRQKALVDFEERALHRIDQKTAIEMMRANRSEMRQLK